MFYNIIILYIYYIIHFIHICLYFLQNSVDFSTPSSSPHKRSIIPLFSLFFNPLRRRSPTSGPSTAPASAPSPPQTSPTPMRMTISSSPLFPHDFYQHN